VLFYYVISELQEYASELPATEKSVSDQTISTVEYLKACNKIFERGVLAKKGFIKDSSSSLIRSMEDGFNFFTNWLDEKLMQGKLFVHGNFHLWVTVTKLLLLLNCFIYALLLLNCFVYRVQDNRTDWEIIFILADLGPHETHVLWFQRDG